MGVWLVWLVLWFGVCVWWMFSILCLVVVGCLVVWWMFGEFCGCLVSVLCVRALACSVVRHWCLVFERCACLPTTLLIPCHTLVQTRRGKRGEICYRKEPLANRGYLLATVLA